MVLAAIVFFVIVLHRISIKVKLAPPSWGEPIRLQDESLEKTLDFKELLFRRPDCESGFKMIMQ